MGAVVLASICSCLVVAPASACVPVLYENSELDQLSFIDPGILDDKSWTDLLVRCQSLRAQTFLSWESLVLAQRALSLGNLPQKILACGLFRNQPGDNHQQLGADAALLLGQGAFG